MKLTRCPRTGAPRVLSTIRADVKNVFVPIIVGDNPKPRSDLKCLIVPIVIVVFQLCSVFKDGWRLASSARKSIVHGTLCGFAILVVWMPRIIFSDLPSLLVDVVSTIPTNIGGATVRRNNGCARFVRLRNRNNSTRASVRQVVVLSWSVVDSQPLGRPGS